MARLQILELPEGSSDDRPPFVLVVDQWTNPFHGYPNEWAATVGAQGVLVFEDTIDIPANDTAAYLGAAASGHTPADIRGELIIDGKPVDWTRVEEARARAVDAAQERTDIARDMDRLAKRKSELLEALGMHQLRDWDDIRNAAAGLRREHDAQGEALERVRSLPEQPEVMDAQHPDPSGYLHGYRVAIRDTKRAARGDEEPGVHAEGA